MEWRKLQIVQVLCLCVCVCDCVCMCTGVCISARAHVCVCVVKVLTSPKLLLPFWSWFPVNSWWPMLKIFLIKLSATDLANILENFLVKLSVNDLHVSCFSWSKFQRIIFTYIFNSAGCRIGPIMKYLTVLLNFVNAHSWMDFFSVYIIFPITYIVTQCWCIFYKYWCWTCWRSQ